MHLLQQFINRKKYLKTKFNIVPYPLHKKSALRYNLKNISVTESEIVFKTFFSPILWEI